MAKTQKTGVKIGRRKIETKNLKTFEQAKISTGK